MSKTIVYKSTNKNNCKFYIGITSQKFEYRQRQHAKAKRGWFSLAIKKYGADAFHWEILSEWDTREEAAREEMRLIVLQKPFYNYTIGGDLPPPRSKRVICLNDGMVFDSQKTAAETYGLWIGGINSSCRRGWTTGGLHFSYWHDPMSSEECKLLMDRRNEKLKETQTRTHKSALERHKRPIICLDDGKVYESSVAAARAYGSSPSGVRSVCHGYLKTTAKKRFSFLVPKE